jgi:hypothetical protein
LPLIIQIRRLLLLISLIVLLTGWILSIHGYAVTAAILFLTSFPVETLRIFLACRFCSRSSVDPTDMLACEPIDRISAVLNFAVFFAGIFGILYSFDDHDDLLFFVPGLLIVCGTSLLYLLSGFILDHFAGLPMELTSEGWKIIRKNVNRENLPDSLEDEC